MSAPQNKFPARIEHSKFLSRLRIEPQRQPEGFVLRDLVDRWSWPKFILGGIFTLGWNWFFGSMVVFSFSLSEIISSIFLLFALLIGLFFLFWFISRTISISRIEPGEIILPSWPLRMGESARITFRRRFRKGIQMKQPGQVYARLVCLEVVSYRKGTDTVTVSEPIWEIDLPSINVASGTSKLDIVWEIEIPGAGPPSFEAQNNKICWGIDIWLEIPGLVKDDSVFALLVKPEVVG